jgi:hypothetical protein
MSKTFQEPILGFSPTNRYLMLFFSTFESTQPATPGEKKHAEHHQTDRDMNKNNQNANSCNFYASFLACKL